MPIKKVVKKTIEEEAQELLDKKLHDIKVEQAARILTDLNSLEVSYLRQKKHLEENLAEVNLMGLESVYSAEKGSRF